MKKKVALITGITGQDGSYLAELLLKKGYFVHGLIRKSSSFNTQRIEHLFEDPHYRKRPFKLHYGDLTDALSISSLLKKTKPDEIYNLGAQSHVKVSFDTPEYTLMTDALGTLRLLDTMIILKMNKTKFYQASTSELFGKVDKTPQNELTRFNPQSPYALAKMYSYFIVKNYREVHGLFCSNGILFNHESPRRGETFVTRKITRGVVDCLFGSGKKIFLGNLNSKRDWGHAREFCEAMYKIMQYKKPEDFVIATGKQYTVRDFVKKCFKYFKIEIKFFGSGLNEKAKIISLPKNNNFKKKIGDIVLEIDGNYFRPLEVDNLKGDFSKAKKLLKWSPKISLDNLIKEMLDNDLNLLNQ